MSDVERIPTLDMRLAPECSADPALAAVQQIRSEEREARARWQREDARMREAMHDAAIAARVERLKRGELPMPPEPTPEQIARANPFINRGYGLGASYIGSHHAAAGTMYFR